MVILLVDSVENLQTPNSAHGPWTYRQGVEIPRKNVHGRHADVGECQKTDKRSSMFHVSVCRNVLAFLHR